MMLAPEIFPSENGLLVTSGKLTAARKKQIDLWQQQVNFLEVIPAFNLQSLPFL